GRMGTRCRWYSAVGIRKHRGTRGAFYDRLRKLRLLCTSGLDSRSTSRRTDLVIVDQSFSEKYCKFKNICVTTVAEMSGHGFEKASRKI
ncbi:unnamed protein product, partial [Heterotrigona itama]